MGGGGGKLEEMGYVYLIIGKLCVFGGCRGGLLWVGG